MKSMKTNDVKKTAVIMSSYNGEKYICEQIKSILSQKNTDITLFIRDDKSSDSTRVIINNMAKNHSNIVFINETEEKNVGVKYSFLIGLKFAYNYSVDFEYFAFADQDDIWLPEKINTAIGKLEESNELPSLYYSNKTFVNERLELIAEEKQKFYDDFYSIFFNTGASGCTMVFNRKLAAYAIRNKPYYTKLHDQWLFRLAHCLNGHIVFGETSYIYYRQHKDNVLGMESCKTNRHNWAGMFKKSEHTIQKALLEIDEFYHQEINKDIQKYIQFLSDYDRNFISKVHLATDKLAFRRGGRSYILFLGNIIRGSY